MFKNVICIMFFIVFTNICYSQDYPGLRLGLSLGFFYTEHKLLPGDSTIEQQVDSISTFMVNMKFGGLLRLGYHFNSLFSAGTESGILFNNYHINVPFRVYGKLGSSNFNIKGITGFSYVREKTYNGSGIEDIGSGITMEYGGRVEIMHVYIEILNSYSLSPIFSDSTKISFGYSLFFPDIR